MVRSVLFGELPNFPGVKHFSHSVQHIFAMEQPATQHKVLATISELELAEAKVLIYISRLPRLAFIQLSQHSEDELGNA